MPDTKRKLAAIVFTDIVGFTKLSSENEPSALALLEKQRNVLKPIVQKYSGEWMKEIGDGLLLTFDTTRDAVFCAIEIQKVTKPIKDLNLRIGIHQGEVVIQGSDVVGDDVNIASRIEPFSPSGGVSISDRVNASLNRDPEFETVLVGSPNLKGVSQEIRIYNIISHGLPRVDLRDVSAKLGGSKKKDFKFINVMLLLTVVIGGGYYYYIKAPTNKSIEKPSLKEKLAKEQLEEENINKKDIEKKKKPENIKSNTPAILIVYEHHNYSGIQKKFFSLEDLSTLDNWENEISSLKLISNYQVTIFENKNFEGKTITLIGEVPDLKVLRWGDKISSIKIQRAQKDINVALAFQHSDFKGEFLNLNLGAYNNLKKNTWFNDDISSIRINKGYRVIVYEHDSYQGKRVILNESQSELKKFKMNDEISSLVVEKLPSN